MWGEALLRRATDKVVGKVAGTQLARQADAVRADGGLPLRIVLPDGAHVDFLSRVRNPIGVKVVENVDFIKQMAHRH